MPSASSSARRSVPRPTSRRSGMGSPTGRSILSAPTTRICGIRSSTSEPSFVDAAMGLPGVELRLPLVLSEGGPARGSPGAARRGARGRAGARLRPLSPQGRARGRLGRRRRRVGSARRTVHHGRRSPRRSRAHALRRAAASTGRSGSRSVAGNVVVRDGELIGDVGAGRFVAPVDADRRIAAARRLRAV